MARPGDARQLHLLRGEAGDQAEQGASTVQPRRCLVLQCAMLLCVAMQKAVLKWRVPARWQRFGLSYAELLLLFPPLFSLQSYYC